MGQWEKYQMANVEQRVVVIAVEEIYVMPFTEVNCSS